MGTHGGYREDGKGAPAADHSTRPPRITLVHASLPLLLPSPFRRYCPISGPEALPPCNTPAMVGKEHVVRTGERSFCRRQTPEVPPGTTTTASVARGQKEDDHKSNGRGPRCTPYPRGSTKHLHRHTQLRFREEICRKTSCGPGYNQAV